MAVFNTENIRTTVWIALKRLDLNDNRVTALREVPIPSGAKVTSIKQILAHSFRIDTSQLILKIRNNRGCLIPLNCCMPPNSKQICLDSHSDGTHSLQRIHWPYVLEVAKYYQHVNPRLRSIPTTVINKSLKSRQQSVVKRIERLEELLPQIKLKHHEKMTKDIELLNQKLVFLHKRMQMAESYCWEGMLRRAPLW